MKTIECIFISILLLTTIHSCENHEYNSPIGEEIGLEKNEIIFSTARDSIIVKTKNGYWGISAIYEIVNDSAKLLHEELHLQDTVSFDWYTSYKIGKDIFVKVEENNTGKDRNVVFILMSGNTHDQLLVQQVGK